MPKVIFFMIDGLRPDAIALAHCPHIVGLRERGASTLTARSIMPSVTLPCHMSIFHSVEPARHGIVTNDWLPLPQPLPGLFEIIYGAGLQNAFFYNWEPLRNIGQPGSVSLSYCRENGKTADGDQLNAHEAARMITINNPDFVFMYFGCVDETGHAHGWMSDEYFAQIERADDALGTVLAALSDDCALVLQSDHGGHDHLHGTESAEDMTIPWIAVGPGIRRGYEITQAVSLLDTAPTIARLLNITPPVEWQGRCVEEIFE